jgi:ribosomal protein uS4
MKLRSKRKYIKDRSYDKNRYNLDRNLIVEFGLRNKKQIGKYKYLIKKYRRIYRLNQDGLIKKQIFMDVINKLTRQGILQEGKTILDLTIQDFLNRRLQTIVFNLKLSRSQLHARQLITHKHIKVNNLVTSVPSRIINITDIVTK